MLSMPVLDDADDYSALKMARLAGPVTVIVL